MPGKEDTYATSMSCATIPPKNQFSYHWALIVGPKVEMDNTIVADLISGNAQAGDTVRDE